MRNISTLNNSKLFQLISSFVPGGDQPQAIEALCQGIEERKRNQVLLGVTGSGKTFTMAHVIQKLQRPTLIMAPNKTLGAQLYGEMREFFPHNSVEYFVSYYDYYQPEAYVPRTDTYIEKDASINEQIDRMRHSATRALLERRDVIVVASVSCIYGLGSTASYQEMSLSLMIGKRFPLGALFRNFIQLQYKRNDMNFQRGSFRVRGDRVDIFPSHYDNRAWMLSFFGDELESIFEIDALTGEKLSALESVTIYPNSHYVTPGPTLKQAIVGIRKELEEQLAVLGKQDKFLQAQRLCERTQFDIETLIATGSCPGIENYSRYLTGRSPGDPPPTLFEYIPKDALLMVDESHVSLPQIRGMSKGDAVRKQTLSEYGFRLPSCRDNRPLTFEEWDRMRPITVFVSATPGPWEVEQTCGEVVEQVIRPTGLLDPKCILRPTEYQVDDLMDEISGVVKKNGRILVTTLTKKMAEDFSDYLSEAGFKVRYMHSDIDTLERIEILQDLRSGVFDVLVGINLLREGLDIPQCQLVAILDADKEGYLRSKTSLIQIIGRAARHPEGRVLLYGDRMTNSLRAALEETARRREIQQSYNEAHGITPQLLAHKTKMILSKESLSKKAIKEKQEIPQKISKKNLVLLKKEMLKAAENLEFEKAAELRDIIKRFEPS